MSADPKDAVVIAPQERLIVALDVDTIERAKTLVTELADNVHFYKIGLELAMSGRYFELLQWLLDRGKRVFTDLKLYDIPATVTAAVRQLRSSGASFLTVHGERSVAAAAARAKGSQLRILAVTVLTSTGQDDLRQMGIELDLQTLVLRRAHDAIEAGCDGVIASGLEARALRRALGPDALIVTPGVRPAGGGTDDQRRVVTPAEAIAAGADYIVVGRPVRDAPSPYRAAAAIQAEISAAL